MELLIDGDIILYQVALSCQRVGSFKRNGDGDVVHHVYGVESEAIDKVKAHVDRIFDRLKGTSLSMAITDSKRNFRKRVMPGYKAHRASGMKPVLYHAVRDFLVEEYGALKIHGLEADDVLGIWQTTRSGPTIICSTDKDMQTIPGEHYNWEKDRRFSSTVEEADRHHLYQTLTGDTTDGYPGAKGIGPVKANRLLDEACTWEQVVKGYAKSEKLSDGDAHDKALVNARMAFILRKGYTRAPKQVRLWSPHETGRDERETTEWLSLEDN